MSAVFAWPICARADEQLRADLLVRQAIGRQARDLLFLRRELTARRVAALPRRLARRDQSAARTLGERLHPDRFEDLVRRAQPLAGVLTPSLAA